EDPNSEQYGIAPMAAAWWLATRGGWRSAAASGACSAAATAMNPAFGVIVPVVAFELWRANAPDASPRWVRLGAAAGGGVAVLAAPVWSQVVQPQLRQLRLPPTQRVVSGVNYGPSYPAAEYVRAHTKPDDTLYVSGNHGEVYWLADRRAPTRFFDNFR